MLLLSHILSITTTARGDLLPSSLLVPLPREGMIMAQINRNCVPGGLLLSRFKEPRTRVPRRMVLSKLLPDEAARCRLGIKSSRRLNEKVYLFARATVPRPFVSSTMRWYHHQQQHRSGAGERAQRRKLLSRSGGSRDTLTNFLPV